MRESVREEIEAAESDLEFPPVEQEVDPVAMDLAKRYGVADAKIAELKEKYTVLKIAGVEDKKGYALVHDARMEVRDLRLAVEKKRVTLKADVLEYGRKVDAEATRIKKLLEPIESHLDAEETRIDAEAKALKEAAQREKEAKLQARIDALTKVGAPAKINELAQMNDTVFEMVLRTATETWEAAEVVRKQAEAALAEKRAEEERQAREAAEAKAKAEAAERARLAEEGRKQAEEREALRKEREAFEKQKAEAERAAREEQIRKEAAEKAKADAERRAQEETARKEREAQIAEEKRQTEEARRKAQEAARPDAERITALAETLRGTAFPKMATPDGERVMAEIQDAVGRLAKFIDGKAASITSPVFG